MTNPTVEDQDDTVAAIRRTGHASRWRPRAFIVPILVLAWAGSVAAQEPAPTYAPCLIARETTDDYLVAFQAEGWTLMEGSARGRALRGLVEVRYLRQRVAQHFGDPPQPAEDLAHGIAVAETEIRDTLGGALVLTRDEVVMVVQAEFFEPGEGMVACVLTAPDLPDADSLLASGDVVVLADTLVMATTEPPPPPGASSLSVVAQHYTPRVTPVEPLVGLEAVTVSLTVGEGF